MNPRLRTLIVPLLLAPAIATATPEANEFGERLLETASTLTGPERRPLAEATVEAALRVVSEDPRLLRMAADIELALGNRDKAIELLNGYRKLDPKDQLAQVQTIDLLVDGMESTDQKEAYLKQVLGSDAVSNEVRSHAGVLLIVVLKERSRDDQASATLDEALRLNPHNPKALQLAVERAFAYGDASMRTASIVNLLKSNPMQPQLLCSLGNELARVGVYDQALQVYRMGFDMYSGLGMPAQANDAINATSVLLSAGANPKEVQAAANAGTQLDPSSSRAWIMRAVVEKSVGDAASLESTLKDARNALTRNLMVLHRGVDPTAPEVTQDTTPALPDIRADAAKVAAGADANLTRMYATALSDLAWIDAFFTGRAPDDSMLAALNALLGENSVVVTRLQGFAALAAGQDDEATVKLSAIAQQDPLARAGLIGLRAKKGESKDTLRNEAVEMLVATPIDVWSCTLRYIFRDLGPIKFRTKDADAVIAEVAKLPAEWLDLPKRPGAFYVMSLKPVRVGILPGEPMFMRLSIQNISKYPLVIGPGGVIDQQVAIDATARGGVEQYVGAIGAARLTGRIVLQPRQSVAAMCRLQSGELSKVLGATTHVAVTLYPSAVTNPRQDKNGSIVPGPGGAREQSESVIDRPAASLNKESVRKDIADRLASPDAMQHLLALRTLNANVLLIRAQPTLNDSLKQLMQQADELMRQSLDRETDPSVKAQGMQMYLSQQTDPNTALPILNQMIQSKDWQSKVIGALLVGNSPKENRKIVLQPLLEDSDELVKRIAEAVLALPEPAPPATQPAS